MTVLIFALNLYLKYKIENINYNKEAVKRVCLSLLNQYRNKQINCALNLDIEEFINYQKIPWRNIFKGLDIIAYCVMFLILVSFKVIATIRPIIIAPLMLNILYNVGGDFITLFSAGVAVYFWKRH